MANENVLAKLQMHFVNSTYTYRQLLILLHLYVHKQSL